MTDILKRPTPKFPDGPVPDALDVYEVAAHEHAVAKMAMRFARNIANSNVDCTDIPQDVIEEAFELVKAVDESGWTP